MQELKHLVSLLFAQLWLLLRQALDRKLSFMPPPPQARLNKCVLYPISLPALSNPLVVVTVLTTVTLIIAVLSVATEPPSKSPEESVEADSPIIHFLRWQGSAERCP